MTKPDASEAKTGDSSMCHECGTIEPMHATWCSTYKARWDFQPSVATPAPDAPAIGPSDAPTQAEVDALIARLDAIADGDTRWRQTMSEASAMLRRLSASRAESAPSGGDAVELRRKLDALIGGRKLWMDSVRIEIDAANDRATAAEALAAERGRALIERNNAVIEWCAVLDKAGEAFEFDPADDNAADYFCTVSKNAGLARVVCEQDNVAIAADAPKGGERG